MLIKVFALCLLVCQSYQQDSVISGYGPVSLDDLHPLSLSWNQVHYLVRDSLLEIEELAKVHDEFYKELHECFGIESCIKQANMLGGPPQSGRELGAGALLTELRQSRIEELSGQHSQISAGVSHIEQQLRQRQEQQRRKQLEQQQRQRQEQEELQRQRQEQEDQQRRLLLQQQQQQQQRQGGQQRQRQQQSSVHSSSFRHSRTGSSSAVTSAPISTSWSSSSTFERKMDGTGYTGGSYSVNKQFSSSSSSSSSGTKFGGVPRNDYDDYEDGPVSNRG